MKTKSTINLFATAILATATISAVNVATHPSDVFASEVTQIPNKNNVGTRTTFETDPVFKNYKDAEKYLESYVKPTIEKSRYGYFTATVLPDGLGGKYLVEGFIDSHSEDEEVIKGNKETAQKIVDNASKPMPISESVKPAEKVKPVTPTPAKPAEGVKPATPAKPVDEGKTSNDIKEITGEFKFTEIKTTSTGLTFKAKLPEVAPHAGPVLPNIQATLTDKATGKEVAKTGVVLEGLSDEFKTSNALLYSNLLEGTIFEPSLTSGNYILTVEGTTGPTYGQNTDKRKRHFVFSKEVTLTGEGNATTTTQPEKPKDSTTKPKSDQTTNNVNNNQQPNNDKNKQSTNNNTGKQDKNELSTNKNSDKKTDKQNSDNTLSQEKQQATSTSTTKPENNKNNDKKTLPNTGESTSTLGIIGTILSIAGLGFIVKRKRG
ncbi:LPXTG cell wall anchor domain-containing protein [Streptococcus mitis]|uniref:LPXTG cell wall anchor domain-containing protein n=1 Tax=Streptococcus mitis TaxID=28037 RepID=UPI0020011F21|nr:LPXTG cell wall anchor domain-containing protein [Streptococcus mitis]